MKKRGSPIGESRCGKAEKRGALFVAKLRGGARERSGENEGRREGEAGARRRGGRSSCEWMRSCRAGRNDAVGGEAEEAAAGGI